MSPARKIIVRRFMAGMLVLSATLARRPRWQPLSFAWSRWLARQAVRRNGIGPVVSLAALGEAWQRGFPSARQVPIEAITGDTVHARIETPCPLRGSGNTAACWRMMEYDRAVAGAAGGQFVVLQSQAEPGITHCRVALRLKGSTLENLAPAHIRAPVPSRI